MLKIRLDLDQESFERLAEIAVAERRPIGWQAEVLLRRAISDWFSPAIRGEPAADSPAGMRGKA